MSVGRPETDDAEGDVVLAGQPAQQLRPRGLQHGIDRGVLRTRQLAQGPRDRLQRHPERLDAALSQLQAIRRADQGGAVEPGQHLTPRPLRQPR